MARKTEIQHEPTAAAIALPEAWPGAQQQQQQEQQQARQEQLARSETLEHQALAHARCDDAAKACWYMARSLGAARQLEAGEPSLELLFQLLGALADLPADIGSAALPEIIGGDQLGIGELCQQLAMARERSAEAWVDAELAAPAAARLH